MILLLWQDQSAGISELKNAGFAKIKLQDWKALRHKRVIKEATEVCCGSCEGEIIASKSLKFTSIPIVWPVILR